MGVETESAGVIAGPENNASPNIVEMHISEAAEWESLCKKQGIAVDEGMPNPNNLPVWTREDRTRYLELQKIFGKEGNRETALDRDYDRGLRVPPPLKTVMSQGEIDNVVRKQELKDSGKN